MKKRMDVTSKDVARLAKVSQSTVSRALRPDHKMNEELRNKVLNAARQLNYRPNALARGLLSNKINIVGIVAPDIKDPFISSAINYLVDGLQEAGFQSLLFVPKANDDIDSVLDKVLEYQMSLLIVFTSQISTKLVNECMERGITAILFNRYIPSSNTSTICCNDLICGRLVAAELYNCGYRHFCFVSGDNKASTVIDRKLGFMLQLQEYGINDFAVIESGAFNYEAGLFAGEQILALDKPIDACFCSSDTLALGVLDYLRHKGKKNIPEEIGLIGFDDIPMSRALSYDLTTVRQPWAKLIEATIATVKEYAANPATQPIIKIIEGKLIIRGTTRNIKKEED